MKSTLRSMCLGAICFAVAVIGVLLAFGAYATLTAPTSNSGPGSIAAAGHWQGMFRIYLVAVLPASAVVGLICGVWVAFLRRT
jgi:hypothetical protein